MRDNTERSTEIIRVRRAFVSVYDRTGLVDFARFLAERNVELYATGGTASFLREASVTVTSAEELTGFSELLSGKVKSLSPRLHGAILFDRSDDGEGAQIKKEQIPAIDMVIVNFYPFHEVKAEYALTDALRMIDIGGPAALRAAAKNFRWVVPVPERPAYQRVMEEMSTGERSVSVALSHELAARVYEITSSYDSMVSCYLSGTVARSDQESGRARPEPMSVPGRLSLDYDKVCELRYGENPHQAASFYVRSGKGKQEHPCGRQLHGKELSFNNLLDLDAAVSACREFERATCVIVKHRTPCGVSQARELVDAYRCARDCDGLSAFGGVVAVNRPVAEPLAQEMSKLFLELIAAPSFEPEALNILMKKKNLRLMELEGEGLRPRESPRLLMRSGPGGLLLQEEDSHPEDARDWEIVTERPPTGEEREGLLFLWKVVRHVVSNAVVIGKADRTLGIGAGQTSRVDAVDMALHKAKRAGHDVRGAWLASDAFFPFRDSVDVAARAGIRAIVQPGGSRRDEECIRAANEHKMAMCFTGRRCFKH